MLKIDRFKSICSCCDEIKEVVNMYNQSNLLQGPIRLCGDCMIQIYEMLNTMEYTHLNQLAELKKQGREYNDTNIKN